MRGPACRRVAQAPDAARAAKRAKQMMQAPAPPGSSTQVMPLCLARAASAQNLIAAWRADEEQSGHCRRVEAPAEILEQQAFCWTAIAGLYAKADHWTRHLQRRSSPSTSRRSMDANRAASSPASCATSMALGRALAAVSMIGNPCLDAECAPGTQASCGIDLVEVAPARAASGTAHERLRLRPLRHRRRLGRRARGAHRRRPRRQGGDRRGIPLRRHLRDPRLRAQEAARLRQPLPRRVRGRGGLRLDRQERRASTGRR